METDNRKKGIIIGTVLIVIGGIFLTRSLGIVPFTLLGGGWQSILIVLGIIFIVVKENKAPGIVLLGLGILFQLKEFLSMHIDTGDVFLPALLIIAGLAVFFGKNKEKCRKHFFKNNNFNNKDEQTYYPDVKNQDDIEKYDNKSF